MRRVEAQQGICRLGPFAPDQTGLVRPIRGIVKRQHRQWPGGAEILERHMLVRLFMFHGAGNGRLAV